MSRWYVGGPFSIFTKKFIGECVKTQLVCFIVTLLRNFIGLDDVYASEITTYLKNIQCCFFGQKTMWWWPNICAVGGDLGVLWCQKMCQFMTTWYGFFNIYYYSISSKQLGSFWSFLILKSDRFSPPTLDFFYSKWQWHMLWLQKRPIMIVKKKLTHERTAL